jgi:hypothetical protein
MKTALIILAVYLTGAIVTAVCLSLQSERHDAGDYVVGSVLWPEYWRKYLRSW